MLYYKSKQRKLFAALYLSCALFFTDSYRAFALPTTLQGPADVSRVAPQTSPALPQLGSGKVKIPATIPKHAYSDGKDLHYFVLKEVKVVGATAFPDTEFLPIYAAYIGKKANATTADEIANAITEHYRAAGYFLSMAQVQDHDSESGIITLKVIEGYIGKVECNDVISDEFVLRAYIKRLTDERPLNYSNLESILLRINDLPGLSFRSILTPLENVSEGAVKLTLVPTKKEGQVTLGFDNSGSRFLGPNELSASYSMTPLPLMQTMISGFSSLPTDELKYVSASHSTVVFPDTTFSISGGMTKAKPGYTLEPFEIQSGSKSLALNLKYQCIRQRQENMILDLTFDSKNISSDLLDVPFTREKTRILRAGATYNASDSLVGVNIVNLTISQGINGLGASKEGDLNLSRASAKPDFTKGVITLSRLQSLADDWSLMASAMVQYASGALYSSEEFGYGGQAFGRAYDSSEITGDHGASAMIEMRYNGWESLQPLTIQPYGYYDIGRVWNKDVGQAKRESAASAGFGARFTTQWGQSANVGLAWPLTRPIDTNVYGGGELGPRIFLQFSNGF